LILTRFPTNPHFRGYQDDQRLSLLDRLAGLDVDPRHDPPQHQRQQAECAFLESAQIGEKLWFVGLELEPSFLFGDEVNVRASLRGFYDDATFIIIRL
jgi:hypothetical protein